ncbi:PA3371 family protein [Pseudomonas sp.]|uniref:PA3371 family protein n=1 Tax=Pseudomonas sp. TaxID=306 RepID=UPI0026088D09|nr:PA3371 family protein [Pseudomonas sp.]
MSKTALSFLILAVMSIALDISLPYDENVASLVLKIATGTFFVLFVAALVVGRKIKFDPLLR